MDPVHHFTLTVYLPKAVITVLSLTILMLGCNDAARDAEPNFLISDSDGKVFFEKFCAANCHGFDNLGTTGSSAGSVDVATFQTIKGAIYDVPVMNNISELTTLSNYQIQAIANYIPTIDSGAKELYNGLCATNCHGIDNLGTTGSATSAGPVDNPDLQSIKIAIRDILIMDRPDLTRLRDDEIRVIADYIVLELDSVK